MLLESESSPKKKSEINKQSTPLIPQNRVLLPHSCQVENYAKTRLKASRVNFWIFFLPGMSY